MLLKTIHQTLDDYLSSMYTLSHSYSTVSSYRLSITNKNKTGFREFLKEKYDLEIITSRTSSNKTIAQLKNLKIFNLFQKVNTFGEKKFKKSLKLKKNSIIIGDTEIDYLIARQLNIPYIFAEYGIRSYLCMQKLTNTKLPLKIKKISDLSPMFVKKLID